MNINIMTGYRKNTDWVMAGRNTGKSRYTLLANFMHERQHKRNSGDIVVYADFLRDEIESYDLSELTDKDAHEVRAVLQYLHHKEDLVQDKLIDADMPKLIKAEMVLFRLKSGDFRRDQSNTSM